MEERVLESELIGDNRKLSKRIGKESEGGWATFQYQIKKSGWRGTKVRVERRMDHLPSVCHLPHSPEDVVLLSSTAPDVGAPGTPSTPSRRVAEGWTYPTGIEGFG